MHRASAPRQPTGVERTRRGLAVVAVLYAIAAGIVIAIAPQSPKSWRMLPDWIALPVQLIAIASSATVVWHCWRTRAKSLSIWALVCAFCVLSLIANYVWNVWRTWGTPSLSIPDLFYLTDYALMTAAYGIAFVRSGGSFRDPRTWLDAVTIVVALFGTFWGTLLGTFLPPSHGPHVDVPYAVTYALSLATWMAMATLLFLRMPSPRLVLVLLIGAGLLDAAWEVGWLATWLTDRNYVGSYYNFGDVLCFMLIACAAAIGAAEPEPESKVESAELSSYAFVPTLSALLAIALVGATLASTRAPDAWILVGLVMLTTLLLFTRQAAARRKLTELNRALAFRVADARLMEVVRQSADAFLVIDAHGIIAFASPATELTIGVAASRVMGTRAATLFGADHEATFERFLGRVIADPVPPAPLELVIESPPRPPRILKLHGANRLANVHINGLTLTISDISEQRALERDVLTAANHERLRLAGDIHDGLGQELSGIALMLQSLTKSPNLGVAQQQLRTIVGHVVDAIRGTRDLARGLSPIYVVRGSLCDALHRLVRETGNKPPLMVEVDPMLDDLMIDELPADHLYRIAREAVQNSIRHGSCSRIDVRLQVLDDHLVLEVLDDGVGYGQGATSDNGFGLRLMEYRARVIGATFEITRRAAGGTLVRVSVRLSNVVRKG
jgi:PAS domain S-box-containing protein